MFAQLGSGMRNLLIKLQYLQLAFVMGVAQLGMKLGLAKPIFKRIASKTSSGRAEEAFVDYQPIKADVFVTTFAKSGTNWMMQIAQQISYYGASEFDHIHQVVPWPEAAFPNIVPLKDNTLWQQSPTKLRVIKTHLDTDYVPYDEVATYLTVIRDPKEVIVSGYFFIGAVMGVLDYLTFDDWVELFFAPDGLGPSWAKHTASFWAWRERPNVLLFIYNQMKQAPEQCIKQVAETMGVSLTEPQMAQVVERSRFAYMKKHESQFAPPQMPFVKSRGVMMRSGKSGNSGEMLTKAHQAQVDEFQLQQLQALGSDFPYSDYF